NRLQFLPPIQEEVEGQVIDDEIESLQAKYKDVSRESTRQLEKLASIVKHKKLFDDLNEKLSNVFPNIEKSLRDINKGEFGKNPEQDSKNFGILKDLKADLIGHERRVKDLVQTGDKLVAVLEDMNMKKKADEVRHICAGLRRKHADFSEEVINKEQALDDAMSKQQSVVNRLEGLKSWIYEVDNRLDETSPISLDKDKLGQQLRDQRLLNVEIDSNKAHVERFAKEVPDMSKENAQELLYDLTERISEIEQKAENRTKELEEVSGSVTELEGNIAELDNWVTEAVESLKSKKKGANQKALKARVDTLYEEKREKEFDMENLRGLASRLIEDSRVMDQCALKESLADVESRWHELTELLVQQVSLEALTEVDGMLRYLDKAENAINTAEPISMDPETLSVQLRDHMSFNDDLSGKRNTVKDIINKCNRMLRETTNAQTDEIKSRLDSIKMQADIVCQLSAERLQQLEAALPLATQYGENQGEIQAWLDEMEAEVRAHGAPGDNLEQIKKQHETLRAAQQHVEDRKPYIDDLNATGLELMELCGDSDAGEIQNKLVSVNERYEKLKQHAREKLRGMSDARNKMTQE
ncbi:hypothetical protein ACJMK2_013614, partial [Sinanodonta woodiana]